MYKCSSSSSSVTGRRVILFHFIIVQVKYYSCWLNEALVQMSSKSSRQQQQLHSHFVNNLTVYNNKVSPTPVEGFSTYFLL